MFFLRQSVTLALEVVEESLLNYDGALLRTAAVHVMLLVFLDHLVQLQVFDLEVFPVANVLALDIVDELPELLDVLEFFARIAVHLQLLVVVSLDVVRVLLDILDHLHVADGTGLLHLPRDARDVAVQHVILDVPDLRKRPEAFLELVGVLAVRHPSLEERVNRIFRRR